MPQMSTPSGQTATAAVWRGPEGGFELERIPLPSNLSDGEVLVRVRLATLCGSDLHTVAGERETPLPTVLGHEMVGDVLDCAGPVRTTTGEPVRAGMRISWSVGASCGRCRRCRRDMPQKCLRLAKYGHAAITDDWQLNGGLGTHAHLLPGTGIVRVPDTVDDRVATPANCATATIVSAVHAASLTRGDTVVVQGTGMLGLTAIAYLRALGHEPVLGCDLDPERRRLAEQAGATEAVPPERLDERVAALTDGEGAGAILDLTGSSPAIQSALRQLGHGGRMVLVGSVFPSPSVLVDPEYVVRRLLTITGVHNYQPDDLETAMEFLGSLDEPAADLFRGFVPRVFPLDRVAEAVAYANSARPPRVAVDPWNADPANSGPWTANSWHSGHRAGSEPERGGNGHAEQRGAREPR